MGAVAAPRLCYCSGTPRAAGSTPSQPPGNRPPTPRFPSPPPAGPPRATVKLAPPPGPEKGARRRVLVSAGLNLRCRSLPWGHRAEGRSSPSGAFPRPPGGRIAASRRTAARQPRLPNSGTATPCLFSASEDRVPPLGMIHYAPCSLPGGSNKSPPLRRPAQRSGAGALCRATSGSALATELGAGQGVGTQEGAHPSAGHPADHSFASSLPRGHSILAAVPGRRPEPRRRGPELSSRSRATGHARSPPLAG